MKLHALVTRLLYCLPLLLIGPADAATVTITGGELDFPGHKTLTCFELKVAADGSIQWQAIVSDSCDISSDPKVLFIDSDKGFLFSPVASESLSQRCPSLGCVLLGSNWGADDTEYPESPPDAN